MKTTIDIPTQQLEDAMRLSNARTKREAVLIALEEYNRKRQMAALVRYSGTCSQMMSNDEIEALELGKTKKQKPDSRSRRAK